MNKLFRIPLTDRALVVADDPHGQAEHYPGGLAFNTQATAEIVRDGQVIDRRELGSGVITTAGINKWAAMLNAKQGPLYTSGTTAFGPYMLAAGTGTTAPAISDTALQTAIGTTGVTYASRGVNLLGFTVNSVAYGNGVYVAVGSSGGIATSTDLTNWTVRVSPAATSTGNAIAFGNSIFVFGTTDGQLISSFDNGISWTITATGYTYQFNSVVFGGSTFAASTSNASTPGFGKILTSTNGTTWTLRVSGLTQGTFIQYVNGTFVATGNYSGSTLNSAYSADGSTWSTGSANQVSSNNIVVVYVGSKYVFLASNFTYNSCTTPFSGLQGGTVPYSYNAAATSPSGLLVFVGNSGSIFTTSTVSNNAGDYTVRASGTNANLTYVTYQNGNFIAFSSGYVILTSSDGATWTKRRVAVASGGTTWFSSASTYLLVSGGDIAKTTDLISWYKQPVWYKFTTTYSNPYTVTEFGVFGANGASNTLSGATLFDRRTFSEINVTGGDSINWYWGVTGAAGG